MRELQFELAWRLGEWGTDASELLHGPTGASGLKFSRPAAAHARMGPGIMGLLHTRQTSGTPGPSSAGLAASHQVNV